MMADRRLPHPRPALITLVCTALLASPAAAASWKFRVDDHAGVEVNGDMQTGARLLATDASSIYLVELPFDSKYVLVDVWKRSAILMMRSEVKRVKSAGGDDVILIDQRSGLGTPSYTLHFDGRVFDFQTDISFVRVYLPDSKAGTDGGDATKKTDAAPANPGPETPPTAAAIAVESWGSGTPQVVASDEARACVRLETISSPSPGCARSVYVRNSCDKPVVALVSQTQHLMSGALSDAFSVQAPPRGTSWVACAWWSGAMAPAMHDLMSAGFVEPPPPHGHPGHRGGHQGP